MGQFLSIGLWNKIWITQKETKEQALNQLQNKLLPHGIDLSLYDTTTDGNTWEAHIKPVVLENELLPFLHAAYALLSQYSMLFDHEEILEALAESEPAVWHSMIHKANFYNFQEDRSGQAYYLMMDEERFRISFHAISLKMAGKIVLESGEGLLDLFTDLLRLQLKAFELSKALRVYVTG
ncbi:MAG: hypothetical protein AAF847_19660 [Bacteroidota bacterium]